ncbi:hypothetical protein PHMEG_000948 [Phytophthora megakarya]|uniref:Pre-mRNA-processing protein 40A n=1 Tax=Phytophthora megakarya TaxID=4795 RepID=A0A225X4A9_9STRA|nr:hypothetical protein PHMEG_000948 [Phytophthora megakarya]
MQLSLQVEQQLLLLILFVVAIIAKMIDAPPPPPPPPPRDADTASEQNLYLLNALQVVDKWSVHDDGEGRLFYYDCRADSSQWEVPEDLASLETQFMMKLMLQDAVARSGVWTAHDTGNGTLYYFNNKTRESVWERPSEWGEAGAEAVVEAQEKVKVVEAQKKLQQEEEKVVKKEKKRHKKQKKHNEKREEEQKEEEVEEQETPLTTEELEAEQDRKAREQKRIEQFRAMLRDKNIMPFSKWSVALPQIAGDPRFVGVSTMDERRAIFEHFVEHRREDMKAEKKNKLKQAKKLFAQLLHEQFQHDSWEPNTTLSVFLSTLESQMDSERYKKMQDDALLLLTVSVQQKIYDKAVAEYKSDALKRDGEQLRLTKFLEDKLSAIDKMAMRWESDGIQKLVREFYSSAASNGEPTVLLSEENQKLVFEELLARSTRNGASDPDERAQKTPEYSNSRHLPREHTQSKLHRTRDSSPRRELRHDRRRSRSHSRSRRSDTRSRSRGHHKDHHRRSSRRRSASSSRSRSRERRSSGRSSRHRRHHSSSSSRSRSRSRK